MVIDTALIVAGARERFVALGLAPTVPVCENCGEHVATLQGDNDMAYCGPCFAGALRYAHTHTPEAFEEE